MQRSDPQRRFAAECSFFDQSACSVAVRERREELRLILKQYGHRLGPDGACFHPFGERRDLRVGQLLFGRHLKVGIAKRDRLHEQTFLDIAGNNRRASITTRFRRGPRIEPQVPFLLLRPVARNTLCFEQRQHGFDKLRGVVGRKQFRAAHDQEKHR